MGALRLGSAVALAGVSALVLGVVLWPDAEPGRSGAPATTDRATLPVTPPAGALPLPAASSSAQTPQPQTASAPGAGVRSAGGVFEADAAGRLVVDERMRLAVEALVGLHPAEAMPELIAAEVHGLPAEAAAQARELAQRLDAYQAAQRAAFPPGEAPLVPQEGLAELETLVALRTSYFGADSARRMFGADEAVTRRLLQLMAEDTSGSQSMQDKAQRAQARYDRERGAAPGGR
jgi:hypothetical protein